MRIQVNERDIKFGRKSSATSCPVALAIKRAVPDTPVLVGYGRVVLGDRTHNPHARIVLPETVSDWIKDFDGDGPAGLLEFDLPLEGLLKPEVTRGN